MALIRTNNFAGIPLFYDRFKPGAYGQEAVPVRPYIDPDFRVACDACFSDIQNTFSGNGFHIDQIWTGGVGREGSGRSYHHTNRAFDLDCLIFSDKPMWVATSFPARPYLYLAIESLLRIHFGTVLNYDYNHAHEDHFHFDNGTSVGFKKHARSHVIFLQHTLEKLFNKDVGASGVDGVWGGDTEAALRQTLKELRLGTLSDNLNWIKYLKTCADLALDTEQSIVGVAGV
ncbi:extensin family protein [Martelella lutilitoris]|nr:extensin family protein [Martelella lutilitoris]